MAPSDPASEPDVDPAGTRPSDVPADTVDQPEVAEALQFTAHTVGGGQFDAASLAARPTVF